MNIAFIIKVLENRLQSLNNIRSAAINVGDLEKIVQIDAEIDETQMTLNELRNG
jgi:hypothetical protein